MATYVRAFLRVGLIGGVTLAFAMAAQMAGNTTDLQGLGFWIVVIGFVVIGAYSAREGGQPEMRRAMRTGALGGLVSGLMVGMVLIAVMLSAALGPGVDRWTEQVFAQITPDQLASFNPDPVVARQMVREVMPVALGLTSAFFGLLFPVFGTLLGLMGGRMAPAVFQMAASAPDGKKKP